MANLAFLASTFKENAQAIKNLYEGFQYFRKTEVVVGITEETNSARGSVNNAELLYIHENGSPVRNIPARPVLKPAIADGQTKGQIETMMREAAIAAMVLGDKSRCEQLFHKAGMIGRDACKNWILGGHLAPNAPSTIRRKGSSTPLVDTGSMLGSITYAVRDKR